MAERLRSKLAALAKLAVADVAGTVTPMTSLWSEKGAVIVLVRRMG